MIDPQLKRGLLDICVLSALRKGDSYGYQIIKDLSGCIEISESTLYGEPDGLLRSPRGPSAKVLPPDPRRCGAD